MGRIWKRSISMLLACSLAVSAANAGDIADFLKDVVNGGVVSYAEGAEWYIFFDNGLSEYDTVEYNIEGVTNGFEEMLRLDRLDEGAQTSDYLGTITEKVGEEEVVKTNDAHVNPEYVYVTPDMVKSGATITFRGTASGRVYDSMSNYQPDSASQEWGYDYVDFVWTSEPLLVGEGGVLTATNNCYYAPALAMQNKYVGQREDGTTEQFIHERGYMTENSAASVNVVGSLLNILRAELKEEELIEKTYTEDHTVSDNVLTLLPAELYRDGEADYVGTTYKIPAGSSFDGTTLHLSAPMEITTVGSAMLQLSGAGSDDLKVERVQYGKLDSEKVRYETATPVGGAYPLSAYVTYSVGAADGGGYDFTYVKVGYSYERANYPVVTAKPEVSGDTTVQLGETLEFENNGVIFGLIASGDKTITVKGNTISTGGNFERPDPANGVTGIRFTLPSAGYVSFTASGGSPTKIEQRLISIYTEENGVYTKREEFGTAINPGNGDTTTHTFVLDEPGTYYIGSYGGGVNYSDFQVRYFNTEGDTVEPEPDPEPEKPGVELKDQIYADTSTATHKYNNQTIIRYSDGIRFILSAGSSGIEVYPTNLGAFQLAGKAKMSNGMVTDAIGFTTDRPGAISFRIRSDPTGEDNVVIFDESGNILTPEGFGEAIKNKKYEFDLDQAGTYYIGTVNGVKVTIDQIQVKYDTEEYFPQTAGVFDAKNNTNGFFKNELNPNTWNAGDKKKIYGNDQQGLKIGGKFSLTDASKSGVSFVPERAGFVVVYALNGAKDAKEASTENDRYVGLWGKRIVNDEEKAQLVDDKESVEESSSAALVPYKDQMFSPAVFEFDPATDGFVDNKYYVSSAKAGINIYRIEVYYYGEEYVAPEPPTEAETEPPVEEPEKEPLAFSGFRRFDVYPYNGTNRTFVGYTYPMEGIPGKVNEVNHVADQTQSTPSAAKEGSFALGNSADDGTSGEVYQTKVTFYDYYSDWELSGKPLEEHHEILPLAVEKSSDNASQKSDVTPAVTFTKNINTVSYSYQGDLWNRAISDYYNKPGEINNGVKPLMFGSNSWMTGNERYDYSDRYGSFDANNSDWLDWSNVPDRVQNVRHSKYTNNPSQVYNIPDEREYFTQFTDIFGHLNDYAMGYSNSRGDDNLVKNTEQYNTPDVNDKKRYLSVVLDKSDQIAPYFNKEFLEGNNDRNAVLGKVYENVSFNLEFNEESKYYVFNSADVGSAVQLTYDANKRQYFMRHTGQTVYRPGNTGVQFFPLNSKGVSTATGASGITPEGSLAGENLMFGMKMTVPLRTYSEQDQRVGLLKFSGDDDVWVYVNRTRLGQETTSQIALDIGGTHGARGGVVSMRDMLAATESTFYSLDRNYGIRDKVVSGEGNAFYEQTQDIETAVFAIATNERIQEAEYTSNGVNGEKAYWFGDVYTYDGTCSTSIIDENGKKIDVESVRASETETLPEKMYFKVVFDGTIYKGGAALQYEKQTKYKVEIWYALYDIMGALDYQGNEVEDDTILYDLNIYCMERGLNSSNFKVALSTIGVTTRTVQKEWSDRVKHFNDHDGKANGKEESVGNITLYREKVSNVTEGVTTFDPNNTMVIRAEAHNVDGDYQYTDAQSAFVDPGSKVTIDMDLAKYDTGKNLYHFNGTSTKYAILALNGIQLNHEVYNQFNKINDNGFSDNRWQYLNNELNLNILVKKAQDTEYEQIDRDVLLDDLKDGILTLPEGTVSIRIEFNAVQNTGTWTGDIYSTEEETYMVENANGWLVELYPLNANRQYTSDGKFDTTNLTSVSVQPILKGDASTPASTTLRVQESETKANPDYVTKEYDAADMRFTIIHNPINAYGPGGKECHVYSVAAVPYLYELDIKSSVGGGKRKVFYQRQIWKGALASYKDIQESDMVPGGEVYGEGGPKLFITSVKEIYELNNYYITIIAGGNGSASKNQNPFYENNTDRKHLSKISFEPVYYTYTSVIEPVRQDGKYVFTLKEAYDEMKKSWSQQWMMLADYARYEVGVNRDLAGVYGDDENVKQFPYRFYIEPEDPDNVNDRINRYYTKYRAYDDQNYIHDLEPVNLPYNKLVLDENGDALIVDGMLQTTPEEGLLYLLERADIESVVRIVNTPVGNLEITKDWTLLKGVLRDSLARPEEIKVQIYRGVINNNYANYPATSDDFELYETVIFRPVEVNGENSQTEYEVFIHDVKVGGGTAVLDDESDEYISTIQSWVYEIQNVPLYDDDPTSPTYGCKYLYYAYEEDPGMEDRETGERVKTYYDPSADTSKNDTNIHKTDGVTEPVFVNEFDSTSFTLADFAAVAAGERPENLTDADYRTILDYIKKAREKDDVTDDHLAEAAYSDYKLHLKESKNYYELYGSKEKFTMHIENIVRPRNLFLSVLKTDANSGEALNGAKFELYVKEDTDPDEAFVKLAEGTTTGTDGETGMFTFDELYKMIEDAGLTPYHKHFKLVETVSPEGYPLGVRNVEFIFRIKPDTGEVEELSDTYRSMYDEEHTELKKFKKVGEDAYEEIDDDDTETLVHHFGLTINIINDKGRFILPDTGMIFADNSITVLCMIGGLGILGLLILNISMRRKKRVKVTDGKQE